MKAAYLLLPILFFLSLQLLAAQKKKVFIGRFVGGGRNSANTATPTPHRNKDAADERKAIFATGMWQGTRVWSVASKLLNSAYFLAIEAAKKFDHEAPRYVPEFTEINRGLLRLCRYLRGRNLDVEDVAGTLKIKLREEDLFENGTEAQTPSSMKALPTITVLFNHNYNTTLMLNKYVETCQKYDGMKIIKEYARSLDFSAGVEVHSPLIVLAELARIEARATADRLAMYAMSVSYLECLALSQKHKLMKEEPRRIGELHPLVVTTLNILQKKYLVGAGHLKTHREL